jgi:hypothetical protein
MKKTNKLECMSQRIFSRSSDVCVRQWQVTLHSSMGLLRNLAVATSKGRFKGPYPKLLDWNKRVGLGQTI